MESDLFIDKEEPVHVNTSTIDGVVTGDYQYNHDNTNSNQDRVCQLFVNDTNAIYPSDLRLNDNRILSFFGKDSGSNHSFRGLMRGLNIHQQSLARALARLVELGLVERSASGFRLTNNGKSIASISNFHEENPTTNNRRTYSPLLQTYIPKMMINSEIAKYLVGKWFDNLRWAGLINGGSLYVLQWVSVENGTYSDSASNKTDRTTLFQVNLRLMSDYIIIETNALTDREKVEAMIASYKILHLLTKLFQSRLDSVKSSYATPLHEIYSQNN